MNNAAGSEEGDSAAEELGRWIEKKKKQNKTEDLGVCCRTLGALYLVLLSFVLFLLLMEGRIWGVRGG